MCGCRKIPAVQIQAYDLFFATGSPINIFPLISFVLGNNFYSKFNFGASAGFASPIVTAGIVYFHSHLYLNYRLTPGYYLGMKAGYRTLRINQPIYSEHDKIETTTPVDGFLNADSSIITIPLYFGWQFSPYESFEIGVDIPIRLSRSVYFDGGSKALDATAQDYLAEELDSHSSGLRNYENFAKI